MTPDERNLVTGLIDRLAAAPVGPKDADAEALIRTLAQRQPDALYLLVQSTLIQEMALQQAQGRVDALESEVKALKASGAAPGAQPRNTASFLGAWGPRPAAPAAAVAPQGTPMGAPQPPQPYAPGAYAPAQGQPFPQQAPAGGGFLRAAAATAAGVVGGTLLMQGISSMFGGHGLFGGGTAAAAPTEVVNQTVNNYYGDQSQPDGGTQAANWDDGGNGDQGYDTQDAGYADDGGFGDSGGDDSNWA